MGWTFFPGAKKSELIKETLNPGPQKKILDHVLIGNNLWVLEEQDKDPTIVYYQIAQECKRWGIQEAGEGTAPINCPLFFLDLAPPTDRKWRQLVVKFHENHNKKPQPKEVWSLQNCSIPHITVTEVRGRKIVGTYLGVTYTGPITDLRKRLRSWGVPATLTHH